jgi:hypothetical protein
VFVEVKTIYAGDDDVLVKDLLACISPQTYRNSSDKVISFITGFHSSLAATPDCNAMMIKPFASKFVLCMNVDSATLSSNSIKSFLSLCAGMSKSSSKGVDIGKDFIKRYIESESKKHRVPNEIYPAFGDIMSVYAGDNDAMTENLLVCVSTQAYRNAPDQILSFLNAFHAAASATPDGMLMTKRFTLKVLECMKLEAASSLKTTISSSAVKSFLSLCAGMNEGDDWSNIVVCFIRSVTVESCQDIQTHQASYHYSSRPASVQKGKGPVVLCGSGIKHCCEKFGWKLLEGPLVDAVKKMIEFGSLTHALSLVKELKSGFPSPAGEDARSSTCSKLANIVVEEGLKFASTPTVSSLKDLFFLLPSNDRLMSEGFVAKVLKLDIRMICVPFVTSVIVGKASVDSPLGKIAAHCAHNLSQAANAPLEQVRNWSIKERTRLADANVAAFLKSPCKIIYNYQLAKTKHKMFLQSIAPYISSGEIQAQCHQPSNYWFVKITKLKSIYVDPRTLGVCDCQHSRSLYGSGGSTTGSCIRQASTEKIAQVNRDSNLLKSILAVLPDSVATEIKNKKRKSSQPAAGAAPPKKKPEVIVID